MSVWVASSPALAQATNEIAAPEVTDPVMDGVRPNGLTYYTSVFAGNITDQDFHQILLEPWDTEFLDSWMVGGAIGFERPTRWSRVDLGAEVQLVKWFGDQDHWELNAMPILGRYRFEGTAWLLRSVSFGLGLSYASEVPVEEVIDDGESNRFMVYWAAEAEFGRTDSKYTPFIKLHHRSNAFGLIDEDAGSNTLALGLRRRF
jgi:hypothetical protein